VTIVFAAIAIAERCPKCLTPLPPSARQQARPLDPRIDPRRVVCPCCESVLNVVAFDVACELP
jgi:hypothetical protein